MWISRAWPGLPLFLGVIAIALTSAPLAAFAVFLFGAGWLARYWSRHAFDHVTYERLLPESRAFAGETLNVTLRLINDKPLPLPWIEVREPAPEGVQPESGVVSPAPYPGYVHVTRSLHLGWYERVSWQMPFHASTRGYYRIGPARLSSGDVFGLYPVEQDEDSVAPIVVYPRLYDLPALGLPPERPFGEIKGRQRIFEDPSRIAGLRDYRPGDSMRRIDWKASARLQTLQSRVYEPSGTLHLLVALNVNTLAHTWEGYVPETLERLLSLAGSVARFGFDNGYSVGMVANGSYPESDRPLRVPVGRRPDQLSRILEALAVISPLTLAPIEAVIDREAQRFPLGATLVCVTSRLDEPLRASLLTVAAAGHATSVLSLADHDLADELPGIRVYDLSSVMTALAPHIEPPRRRI